MTKPKVFTIAFSTIYPLYLNKVMKKGRTKEELDKVICWLTGYDKQSLNQQISEGVDLETFFNDAPFINTKAFLIKGVICGIRVEDIEDKMMQKIRYMDKLVDELAKGKVMEKVLRNK